MGFGRAAAFGVVVALAALASCTAISWRTATADSISITAGNDWYGSAAYQGSVYVTTVNVGDTVTWTFATTRLHTVTECDFTFTQCPPDGGFDSDLRNSNSPPFSHAFESPGIYRYLCLLHAVPMRGSINVVEPATSTPTPSATPTETPTGAPQTEGTLQPTETHTPSPTATVAPPTGTPTPSRTPTAEVTMAPADVTVDMVNFAFAPRDLTVTAGDRVRWVNASDTPHTTTSDAGGDGAWDSGVVGAGGSFVQLFTRPGTYAYRCVLHPDVQTGTVTVRDGPLATTTPSDTPTPLPTPGAAAPDAATNREPAALTSAPQLVEIEQREYSFAPDTITVRAGDTVRWVNRGIVAHNSIGDGGAWASPMLMAPGAEFSHTFTTAGTFRYRCTLHANMGQEGTVIVRGAARSPTSLPAAGSGNGGSETTWPPLLSVLGGMAGVAALWARTRRQRR